MSPERWKEIERLYQRSVELPPERRRQFLAESCGDVEIRREVESLLAQQGNAPSFIEQRGLDVARDMITANPAGVLVGRTIGHYEVRAFIAAGGMGEVYRARDSRLSRDVAVKVLPHRFSEDIEQLRRSEREAKLLASLNHPNIAAIYDLEESDGIRCLVLEFVEGQTLAERLKRGRLALGEALEISRQIAIALEAAHEQGIVHRDLKPGNIMIVASGAVKVLDFGIAKMLEPQTETDGPTNIDSAGVVLGTPSYMSPEQARGNPMDKRADIWAFGCVLYELLTGRQAFQGGSVTDTLAAVLTADPDWNRLPEDTPVGIRRLIERCLRKDRNRRLQTIADARIEIEDARAEPGKEQSVLFSPAKSSTRLMWAALIALLSATLSLSFLLLARRGSPDLAPVRFSLPLPANTTLSAGLASPFPTLSPDGRRILLTAVSNGVPGLWLQSFDALAAEPIPGTEGVGAGPPFWSPDGRYIGFFNDGALKKVRASGGLVETLSESTTGGGTWNSDNVILFVRGTAVHRISAGGGASTPVVTLDTSRHETSLGHPSFLPDGRHFLYFASSLEGTTAKGTIIAGSLDSRETRPVVAADSMAKYAPPGYLVFLRRGNLVAQPFDVRGLKTIGDAVSLGAEVANNIAFGAAAFSVSSTGVLAYRAGTTSSALGGQGQLAMMDRATKKLDIVFKDYASSPEFSPDGKIIAFEHIQAVGSDIWLLDLVRGAQIHLTSDIADDRYPIWSPDGKNIVFLSSRRGGLELYQRNSSGTGSDQLLLKDAGRPMDWSLDGGYVLYSRNSGSSTGIGVLSLGDGKATSFLETKYNYSAARFSPNGRWVAYTSDETGRNEVYVQSFPASAKKWPVSANGGDFPQWRRDSKELFFIAPDGKMMAVDVKLGATFDSGVPKFLFNVPRSRPSNRYVVTPDGQRFLFIIPGLTPVAPLTTVVLNWTALLNK